jgi:hypothetical protein
MGRLAAVLCLTLLLAPAASAGGSHVDLVVEAGTVWTVGDFGLHAYSARDGSPVYAPRPTAARYDLSVAIAGGAVFVASVENGMTEARITRIDRRTHATRIVWRGVDADAQYLAAGAGGIYVLVGAQRNSVVRLSPSGRVTGRWPIVDAGRLAADASGCWVATDHRVVHIRPDGRVVNDVLLTRGLEDVATGGGAAWLLARGKLVRIDERTGVVRGLRVGALQPIGENHELAVGAGHLWTVGADALQRRSLGDGRLDGTRTLGGVVDAVTVAGGAVWATTSNDELYRLDPRTLRVTLRVPLL